MELDPLALMTTVTGTPVPILSIVRSDYDGDDVYADWSESIPGSSDPPALLRSFEPGIARVEPWTDSGGDNTAYYHTDMLGTTRLMTGANGGLLPGYVDANGHPTPATFTAFGERVQGPADGASNRYGYVGEHGYQAHEEFPWLHLGARYYDPAMGRFLQRDPAGIQGGWNVYAYTASSPTSQVDPHGLAPTLKDASKGAGVVMVCAASLFIPGPGWVAGAVILGTLLWGQDDVGNLIEYTSEPFIEHYYGDPVTDWTQDGQIMAQLAAGY